MPCLVQYLVQIAHVLFVDNRHNKQVAGENASFFAAFDATWVFWKRTLLYIKYPSLPQSTHLVVQIVNRLIYMLGQNKYQDYTSTDLCTYLGKGI